VNIHDRAYLLNIYAEMAQVYKDHAMYKEALDVSELRQKISDSLFSISKTKEIAKITDAYELEKNRKIGQLELSNSKNTSMRKTISLVTGVIVFILAVLLVYFRKVTLLNRKLVVREKELQELNSMKDKLFSIIGHDLRAPLTQIPAILEIIIDPGTSDEEKLFMFESLREHSNVSLETLDKLLLWGKSLVKGVGFAPVLLNTKNLIRQNIELKKTAAIEKRITVSDNSPDDLAIFCDPTHFDFIIRNLLSNAIKFTHTNGLVMINVYKDKIPGFIVFEVKDNGIGIEKSLLKNIFNPLNSRDGTAQEKGAGIGLMLCKEFAIKNGGDIWVDSVAGSGSSFYFSVKCGV
jgi:signal transduction histidine kinase